MFQKEVADRILAKPNTKKYGRISVLANFRLDIVDSFKISRKCFLPVPDVDFSKLLFLVLKQRQITILKYQKFRKITEILFSGRRKMINKAFLKYSKNYVKK